MINFKITLCWATPLPAKIVYDKKERLETSNIIFVKGDSERDVINRLKGTESDIISNINSITRC